MLQLVALIPYYSVLQCWYHRVFLSLSVPSRPNAATRSSDTIMSRTHTPLSCIITKFHREPLLFIETLGMAATHFSTFPTLSCSLLSSIDQFDDMPRNISEEIDRWREIATESKDHKWFCLQNKINGSKSTRKINGAEIPSCMVGKL